MAACCPTEEKYGYEDSCFEKAVDAHFHCSICYNVLKEPVMCRNNEHIFCRGCITEHLTVNSHTCPECNEDLTIETLRKARLVSNILSELKIKCDYSNRGCQEFIRLEELDSHVENCGFAPVKCSNEECGMEINKREIIHHESTVCEYRKVKCHNCVKIEQDMQEMKEKMEGMNEKMEGLASKEDVKAFIEALMVQMFEKLRFLENTIQISSVINQALNALIEDILVAGGKDRDGNALKSVERFSWKKNVWERVSSMSVVRVGATSFVYENQVFVSGGCDSDVIEVFNLNEGLQLQCRQSIAKLPYLCETLRSVVYQNRAVLFCACGKTDHCAELCLSAPYTCKQLCKIPAPAREYYTVVAFEHKLLIFGGLYGATKDDLLDSVLEFDLITNTFKDMPSLPYSVQNMTGVRWGDQAILSGGWDKGGPSKKVFMYNSKTGNITELPSMLEERNGCRAIITGNTIFVMGGRGKTGRVRSVEAFTLGGYTWRYLPAMNDIRSGATATVLPTKNFH
ncbi:E3 ubiquitin- ligase NRDP1 [Paramuricea clavata]|uniref:E3 ubiquitin- ligase NRDP1 n=1 Tax=Paramuricea clavata TaxID=317549 RepID=A0A7D9JK80_PARCT|nr:E3 ubiquitin- ligase NRDP1 [Paramuricea clavata]